MNQYRVKGNYVMKQKFRKLSHRCYITALVIFLWSFFLYHFVTPDMTISLEFQHEPGKPLVTELFSILGTLFLFSGMISSMIGKIFFGPDK